MHAITRKNISRGGCADLKATVNEEQEEMKKKYLIDVGEIVILTSEDIDDIMCGALEGGITYWCRRAEVDGDYLGEYASEQISKGGILKLHLYEPFDENDTKVYELDIEMLKNGVKMWLGNKSNYEDLICEEEGENRIDMCNADALVCDAIIQLALFREVVFG